MKVKKEELDRIITLHFDEFCKNIKNQSKKYEKNITLQEIQEIISNCYIKLSDKIENGTLDINTNLKHYFGMTSYNAYFDYLKQKPKIQMAPFKSYQLQEIASDDNSIDEQEHQKLILEIIQNLSSLLTKQQFDIYIKKTINNKTCKQISVEMNLPYRKTTKEFSIARQIVLEKWGFRYEKINKVYEKDN